MMRGVDEVFAVGYVGRVTTTLTGDSDMHRGVFDLLQCFELRRRRGTNQYVDISAGGFGPVRDNAGAEILSLIKHHHGAWLCCYQQLMRFLCGDNMVDRVVFARIPAAHQATWSHIGPASQFFVFARKNQDDVATAIFTFAHGIDNRAGFAGSR